MNTPGASPNQQGPPEKPFWIDECEKKMPVDSYRTHGRPEPIPAGDLESHKLFTFDIISTLIHR
jgi:hypothetical protein